MRETVVCILVRGSPPTQVLLGLKKRGLGAGKYSGFGGKVERGETVRQAAARELEEETGIRVGEQDLQEMGQLFFLFPARPIWSQVLHVFLVTSWVGEPAESAEMVPVWFDAQQLPFEQMWQDARHWLPDVLAGKPVRMRFVYAEDNESLKEVQH